MIPHRVKKQVTLRDIALRGGVSVPTVSRALAGSTRISDRTRSAIHTLAQRMGYAPQIAARALRGGLPPVAGVVGYFKQDGWPTIQILWGLSEGLEAVGLQMAVYPSVGRAATWSRLGRILDQGLVGVLIVAGENALSTQALDTTLSWGIPVVTLEFDHPNAHCVRMDDEEGGREAGRCLIPKAQRFVVFKGRYQGRNGDARVRGFMQALGPGNGRVRVVTVPGGSFDVGWRAARALLRPPFQKPLGIFSPWGDLVALGILRRMTEAGWRAGRDFFLIGYDDLRFLRYQGPGLTTIHQPLHELGLEAARLARDAWSRPSDSPERRILKPTLIRRDTA